MDKNNVTVNKEEQQEIVLINEEVLRSKIYMVRGQKVMLDFELAEIYGYTTTKFNQQVKNNIEKFEEDFMFLLTKEEFENLMSKNLTSSWGGSRYRPYAFTEQGVYMLMLYIKSNPDCHDRLIVLDYGLPTEKVFHCGVSSKDAGRKVCAINKIFNHFMIHPVIDKLLLEPEKDI